MNKSRTFGLLAVLVFVMSFSGGLYGGAEEGEIPFRMLGHLMTVTVKINDLPQNYNFVVDTGGVTFVDKKLADELQLKQVGSQAKINTLYLSGFSIENIFCFTTFDFSHFSSLSVPIHGIIGSNLLERFVTTFDFHNHMMMLSSETLDLEKPARGLWMKFKNHRVNNAPVVDLKINGNLKEAMIDTGQPHTLVLPIETFEKYVSVDFTYYIKSKGLMEKWPGNKVNFNYMARMKTLELAGAKFDNTLCLFGDLPSMLSMPLIGTDFLSQFKIIINFPKDEMVMIPNQDFNLKDNLFSLGLNAILSENNQVFVGGIWKNSPADKAGIRVDDIIVSFNSRKVTLDNLLELQNILLDDNVETIELEVISQGKKRGVLLKKEFLF